jgi:hypothetical protein
MRPRAILLITVFAGALTACDRPSNTPPAGAGTTTESSSTYSSSGSGQTVSPAGTAAPTMAEKKHGGNPVQGQVDPKQAEQHRDFQQKGDAQGPRSAETTPPGPKR